MINKASSKHSQQSYQSHRVPSTRSTNYHRYELEKTSTKHLCPSCEKKRFVRYVDTETGEYLPDHYGRCDREASCGYHVNPYTDGYATRIWQSAGGNQAKWKPSRMQAAKPAPLAAFPLEVYKQYLASYESNVFIQNLLTRVNFPFERKDIERVISQYYLGTAGNGATAFPFIDIGGKVRAVQVKQFDECNHTRVTNFLHKIIEYDFHQSGEPMPEWIKAYNKNDKKVTCLFGEHLLKKYAHNPVALVEAPKTAVYGTLYFGFPDKSKNFLWLAVYNLSSLTYDKCKALKGRDVYLFPDLSLGGRAFKLWSDKAANISKQMSDARFQVSDLLERFATEQDREQGKDIADYLIKLDWRRFRAALQPEIDKLREYFDGITIADETAREYVTRTLSKTDLIPSYDIGNLKAVQSYCQKLT